MSNGADGHFKRIREQDSRTRALQTRESGQGPQKESPGFQEIAPVQLQAQLNNLLNRIDALEQRVGALERKNSL